MSNLPSEVTTVKEDSLLFRHQLDLSAEFKPRKIKTTLSQMIKFRGEKTFRFILKSRDPVSYLFFMTTHLNKMGIKVVGVQVYTDTSDKPFYLDNDNMVLDSSAQDGTGTFQIFERYIVGIVSGDVSFDCYIFINSIVKAYQIQRVDYLLSSQLWSSVVNSNLIDFELICGGKSYPVHKFVLAARSPVFSAILGSGIRLLKTPYVEAVCMEQFLKFIYYGELEGAAQNGQLIKLAETYQIKTLIELCQVASHDVVRGDLAAMASELKWTEKPSVQIKSEPEPDIDLLPNKLILKCSWEIKWTKKMLSEEYSSQMSATFNYQGENFFRAEIDVLKPKDLGDFDGHSKDFKMTFLSYHHQQIGCRVTSVAYNSEFKDEMYSVPREMTRSPAVQDAILQTFTESDSFCVPCHIIFSVTLESTVANFGHKFVDSTWQGELWASAVNKQFTDVEFLVGDESIAAHRSLLSARSPVFAAMFTSGMQECQTRQVHLDDVDSAVFSDFLKFLYTGMLEPTAKNKKELLAVADKYQVETLKNLCQLDTRFDISDVTEAFLGW